MGIDEITQEFIQDEETRWPGKNRILGGEEKKTTVKKAVKIRVE